jgi:hypothetical protein
MSDWMYQGRPLTDPGEAFGFVYMIENRTTGAKYIGKKFFTKAARRQVKGKTKKFRKESDWKSYWGSNARLVADHALQQYDEWTRTVLYLGCTKAECAYIETLLIFQYHALLRPEFYNEWCSVKIRKAHLTSTSLLSRLNSEDHA